MKYVYKILEEDVDLADLGIQTAILMGKSDEQAALMISSPHSAEDLAKGEEELEEPQENPASETEEDKSAQPADEEVDTTDDGTVITASGMF